MNNISISGRLCRNVDLSQTASGTYLAKFTVAVPSEIKDENGDRHTDFITCIAWRDAAQNIAKYFKKGSPIEVYGSMNSRWYKSRNGNTQTVWELNVKGWCFPQTIKEEAKSELEDLIPVEEDTDDLPF